MILPKFYPLPVIKNINVGKNSKIGSSVIRGDVKIGKNCVIENSVIMNGVTIGDGSVVSFSIIGKIQKLERM